MFFDRSHTHSARFLPWKTALLFVGGGIGLVGMVLDRGWVVTVGICLVGIGFLLRFVPARPERAPEDG